MASVFARRPVLITATAVAVAGTAFYFSLPAPTRLDSAYNEVSRALSFPRNMVFSRDLKVRTVERVNHDTKKITLELPGGDSQISGVPASAAILTQHTSATSWFPILRPYTPISSPETPGILQLLVKCYPSGRASTRMHSLQPGDVLTVRGPLPGYTYTPSLTQPRSVLLVAGGAGITPIYSLAREILTAHAGDQTQVQLLWGVNGMNDIVLKDELEELERRYPERFKVTYAISGIGKMGEGEKYRKGHVSREMLEEAIKRCEGRLGDARGMKVFLCGPPKMEEALDGKKGVLRELGLGRKEIYKF